MRARKKVVRRRTHNAVELQLHKVRHSLSHLMAMAVLEKQPKAKLAIGPVIENGFYYDFDLSTPLSDKDLAQLEARMRELIRQGLPFKKNIVASARAKKIFSKAPYKLELMRDLIKTKQPISIYSTDWFIDLCSGPHIANTREINPDAFKLAHLAGAYWRGSEKNKMLTRIYGVAFATKEELDKYLLMLQEAQKRDHRKLGAELKLFMFDDLVGKGLPMWLPNGTIIKNEIEKLVMETEDREGYVRVSTPHLAKKKLYEISGHLPYYVESMYPPMEMDDGTYYVKSMNCPHHHLIYRSQLRSWRDLPLRIAEYGTVYRNELSGALAGLLRVRSLQMNDAHIYCTKDQIEEETGRVIDLTLEYFNIFGLTDYSFQLSLWDPKNKEKYIREPSNWKFSESALRTLLKKRGVKYEEAKNEAAFYGPKIDVQFVSSIGREETMSTIQLDFAAKKRFELSYIDKSGKSNNEVFVIHRAPLSTHERFMAFLIEHYAGAFPTWLAPVQAAVIPVSQKHSSYAEKVYNILKQEGVRTKLFDDAQTLGKRIRESEISKIPYALVVGDKEQNNNSVNVRRYQKGTVGEQKLDEFSEKIKREITRRE
jgi:threonyl-tRNA synthetase